MVAKVKARAAKARVEGLKVRAEVANARVVVARARVAGECGSSEGEGSEGEGADAAEECSTPSLCQRRRVRSESSAAERVRVPALRADFAISAGGRVSVGVRLRVR